MSDQEKAKTDLIYKKFQLKMLGGRMERSISVVNE